MNPGNPDYRRLIVEHVAPRLAATGVDGFFLDNLEIIEHGAHDKEAPCDTTCVRGGLTLVAELRKRFPDLVLVMQNATSSATRARASAVSLPVSARRRVARGDLRAEVRSRGRGGAAGLAGAVAGSQRRPFSITTEDYVGSCSQDARARRVYAKSRERGFSPYASISSANQDSVCYWAF